jgi:hypothetical protein
VSIGVIWWRALLDRPKDPCWGSDKVIFFKFNSFCPALVNDVISNYIIQMGHFNYSPH